MKKYTLLFLVLLSTQAAAQIFFPRATYPYQGPYNPLYHDAYKQITAEDVAKYNQCLDEQEAEIIKEAGGNPAKLSGLLKKKGANPCTQISEKLNKIASEAGNKVNKDGREAVRKEQQAHKKQQSEMNKDIQDQIDAINKQNQKETDASPRLFIGKREIVGGGPTGLMYKDNKSPVQPQDLSKMVEK
jgi:gas vesicle protein